jgi:hypothetical protein
MIKLDVSYPPLNEHRYGKSTMCKVFPRLLPWIVTDKDQTVSGEDVFTSGMLDSEGCDTFPGRSGRVSPKI